MISCLRGGRCFGRLRWGCRTEGEEGGRGGGDEGREEVDEYLRRAMKGKKDLCLYMIVLRWSPKIERVQKTKGGSEENIGLARGQKKKQQQQLRQNT